MLNKLPDTTGLCVLLHDQGNLDDQLGGGDGLLIGQVVILSHLSSSSHQESNNKHVLKGIKINAYLRVIKTKELDFKSRNNPYNFVKMI